MKEARHYWLALSTIKGLGSRRMKKLLEYFEDPLEIWQAGQRDLEYVTGSPALARKIVEERERIDLDRLLETIDQKEIAYITLLDEGYPEELKNISDPPPVLYYKGELNFSYPAVAIVGARGCSNYGKKVAENFACQLAERGVVVISGLARGIDTYAHIGALRAKGKTIAVIACGLDIVYPPENKKLYMEIQHEGSLLSEYPPGVEPLSGHFPQRNRIISGLSQGILVVEAADRSGSLITAAIAREQGRKLFAIPGNIDRPQSRGCNKLIKEGAKLVTKVEDVLEELFLYRGDLDISNGKNKEITYPVLTPEEKEVLKLFEKELELTVDEIIRLTEKSPATVNTILLQLELKGLLSRGPGKKYSFMGLQSILKPI